MPILHSAVGASSEKTENFRGQWGSRMLPVDVERRAFFMCIPLARMSTLTVPRAPTQAANDAVAVDPAALGRAARCNEGRPIDVLLVSQPDARASRQQCL